VIPASGTLRFIIATLTPLGLLLNSYAQQKPQTPAPDAGDRGVSVRRVSSGMAPDGKGQLWAVVIGISSYKNVPPEGQLRFAHRDAEELATFLRSPGGGGFPSNHIKLLLNQDATVSAIRTAIGTWLVRSAEPDDVVYIFFAGHGVVEGDTDGYLLAHDSDPQDLYATALQVSELDRIITQRLHARVVVLMADACHAGQLGWTSRGTTERALVTKYLDEVGKSGAGVVRLLASRANERSFEDNRWGGGHGAFTHFMLEGLKGNADRDKDGFVRVGELLDYLSQIVPEETRALQHPRMAGSIDPRLPLSSLGTMKLREGPPDSVATKCSIELHGTGGTEVYVDNVYHGRIRPSGLLVIEGLTPAHHEISVDPPNAEPFTQAVSLTEARTVLELKTSSRGTSMLSAKSGGGGLGKFMNKTNTPQGPLVATASSPLVNEIKKAAARNEILEPGGAWPLYKQLIQENPAEPQRVSIEISLISQLEEIGQQAINSYVRSSVLQLKASDFRRSAEAYKCLLKLTPDDVRLEAKRLFCEARVAIDEGKSQDAVAGLIKAISLDPRAGHLYNALGAAYEKSNQNDKALEAFKRAAELAPQWSFPRLHIGIQYYARRKASEAEAEFREAIRLEPRDPISRWWLVKLDRERGRYPEAEKTALDLIRVAPDFASAHAELGLTYEAAHEYTKAADELETYLRMAPRSPDAGLIRYDLDQIRDSAVKARRISQSKQPSLKRP
jgi:tetratricopeptide (TPR) repeat protein